jgi:hypothetical protein
MRALRPPFRVVSLTRELAGTRDRLPQLKLEVLKLKDVHSLVLQNMTLRVELAFKAFFRRVNLDRSPDIQSSKERGDTTASRLMVFQGLGLMWTSAHGPRRAWAGSHGAEQDGGGECGPGDGEGDGAVMARTG